MVPTSMKAWRLAAYGEGGDAQKAIDSMTLEVVPVPVPRPGQVLIKVEYASVNPIDWLLMTGNMHAGLPISFPYTPGFDLSGVVVAANGAESLQVGDQVCVDLGTGESCRRNTTYGPCGAFGEYCVVPEDIVARRGDVSPQVAAAAPLSGVTAYQALFTGGYSGPDLGSITEGSKLLVLGGATAVGALAIQLAVAKGAKVFTTASRNAMPDGCSKIDYCAGLGAAVIDYKAADWSEELAGEELELIFDCTGDNRDWQRAPKVLARGGRFISVSNFGAHPREQGGLTCQTFLKTSVRADLEAVLQHIADGKVQVPIDSVVPLAEAKTALNKSIARTSAGKLLIDVSGASGTTEGGEERASKRQR